MSLFLALDPPEEAARALDGLCSWIGRGSGRVRPLGGKAAFHLTLAFLGSPPPSLRPLCLDCAREALASLEGTPAIPSRFGALFALPPRRRTVFCLELDDGSGALAAAWKRLNEALRGVEEARGAPPFNRDYPLRPLLPHLSIARPRGGPFSAQEVEEAEILRRAYPRREALEAPFEFSSCILYESAPERGGSAYRELARASLA